MVAKSAVWMVALTVAYWVSYLVGLLVDMMVEWKAVE
jgi:hypothetical protein